MGPRELWERYRTYLCACDDLGLRVDVSRMAFADDLFDRMRGAMDRAFDAMAALERGEIANPDEGRRVGHYWLRAPALAPTPEIRRDIERTVAEVNRFAGQVHAGAVRPAVAPRFRHLLVIGIGGSALGSQLVADALGTAADLMQPHFLDNTDPDGFERVLGGLGAALGETLAVVISKSGGTPETRNGMLEAERAFRARGLDFARHAVGVTGEGSALDRLASERDWLARFPMWDWVGGRTSVTSAVGLLPARLQGIDVDAFLRGAADADAATRARDVRKNPAAILALMWHHAGGGHGAKHMVVLPYKDRLALLGRYLQQLVMESLGKGRDRDGRVVHQGLSVYGNKGSTDQHAVVQQLRDGLNDFFVTFVRVLRDGAGPSACVEDDATAGDYLDGFWLGTRRALFENGRESITIAIPEVSPRTLGALVALFERAVGLYASLVGVNAYDQPGVEAGKKAAAKALDLKRRVLAALRAAPGTGRTANEIAAAIGASDEVETIFHLLEHLAANPYRQVSRAPGATPFEARYALGMTG